MSDEMPADPFPNLTMVDSWMIKLTDGRVVTGGLSMMRLTPLDSDSESVE